MNDVHKEIQKFWSDFNSLEAFITGKTAPFFLCMGLKSKTELFASKFLQFAAMKWRAPVRFPVCSLHKCCKVEKRKKTN